MRFAVAILACVLAVANAQFGNFGFSNGRYTPGRYQGQFNQGQFNQGQYNQGKYNPYQPFNKYQQYNKYQPYVSTTLAPRPVVAKATASVSATPVPVVAPAPVPVVPVVPAVPAVPVTVARVAADSRSAETLKYGSDINPDGSYNYFFETNNGIAAQQQGTPRNFGGNPPLVPDVAQGSFSWISPEGKTIAVTYVADENGYQPQSDALPVPPPLPPQIARALEYVARNAKN